MAFRDKALAEGLKRNLPKHRTDLFYNIEGWVGPKSSQNTSVRKKFGPPDKPDDVMLVQHFLKTIAANPQKFTHPFIPPRDKPLMLVDGKFGEITRTWIEKFQIHIHNIGRPIQRDGVCDAVLHGSDVSPSGKVFSLVMMNVAMGQITGDDGWDKWWLAPEVPGLLRQSIQDPGSFF